jgi:hypothetical protein
MIVRWIVEGQKGEVLASCNTVDAAMAARRLLGRGKVTIEPLFTSARRTA